MTKIWDAALMLKIWKDSRGQDLVEYALMAGFLVGAAVAFSPALGSYVVAVLGKVAAQLQVVAGDGGTSSPAA